MAADHQNVDDEFFRELRREFSDSEILELGMITGQFIGYGRLLAMLHWRTRLNPTTNTGDKHHDVRRQKHRP